MSKPFTNPLLLELLANMADYLAKERGWSLEDATTYVRAHAIETQAEYRSAGAPFGDDELGLYRWLTERPARPPAA